MKRVFVVIVVLLVFVVFSGMFSCNQTPTTTHSQTTTTTSSSNGTTTTTTNSYDTFTPPDTITLSTLTIADTTTDIQTATWATGTFKSGTKWTFTVYSKNATKIIIEFYEKAYGEDAKYSFDMIKTTNASPNDNYWRISINGLPTTNFYYAFRCWGPNWPYDSAWTRGNSSAGFIADVDSSGNRFNPNKVLYDPYARELSHDKETPAMYSAGENGGMYGTGGDSYNGVLRRNYDTGKWAPKSVAVDDSTLTGTSNQIAQKDAIIYEAHPRGLTKHSSVVNLNSILTGVGIDTTGWLTITDEERGTYKAAGKMAKYLKTLGITTIEFLPIHESANDVNPTNSSGGNYWGYMTYGYFAPDRRYSYDKTPGGPTKEFKEMVKAFHDEGMEVYLDVVYNHTGEGGNWDSSGNVAELTCFRGFDNSEYYSLVPSDKKSYWETTGCGNNLQCDNLPVQNLVKDSLEYWITKMGIDGFRFDLAPVLGRVFDGTNWNYDSTATLINDIAAMTDTYGVEMIAEAWDIGTYQVGNFPNKWGEWNGRYRDTIRKFLKSDSGLTILFTSMFNGDYDNFNDQGGPHKSINFIDAHDGFTLTDLVSYNDKQNTAVTWPFGPSDGGGDDNNSWDSNIGADSDNQALRRQRVRNFIVTQVFSRGIPMIVWGDELGRTQNGNNNPYNVDSVATWNNYNMLSTDSPNSISTGDGGSYNDNLGTDSHSDNKNNIFLFEKNLFNLRKAHVALRQSDYATVTYSFNKEDGSTALEDTNLCVWVYIDGSGASDDDFLLFINMYWEGVNYRIPEPPVGKKFVRIIDTGSWAEYNTQTTDWSGGNHTPVNDNYWDATTDTNAWSWGNGSGDYNSFPVGPRSIVVFERVDE